MPETPGPDAEAEARYAEERERRARRREEVVDPFGLLDPPSEDRELVAGMAATDPALGLVGAGAVWLRRAWRRRSSARD